MKEKIESIIHKYIDLGYFPGTVCKVLYNDQIIINTAIGLRDIEKEFKLTDDTIFDIASISKIISTTMIFRLMHKRFFKLENRVLDLLPQLSDYNNCIERLEEVRVLDLLTHNSGITAWYPFYSEKKSFYEVLDMVLGKTEKVKEPLYSDLNLMLIGKIIEETTKKTLEEALEELILKPLDINKLGYTPKESWEVAPTSYGNIIEKNMCKERNISFDGWRTEDKPIYREANDGNAFYFLKG
jgi:serine-type D-Ala-D-Ala carboxypeptidase